MSDKKLLMSLFKELHIAFSTAYGSRWSDGSNNHYQLLARQWLPVIARDLSESEFGAVVSNISALTEHFKRPPILEEFVLYAKKGNANIEASRPSFDDAMEQSISDLIIRISNDYSTPFGRFNSVSEDHEARVRYWAENFRAFGVHLGVSCHVGYESLIKTGRYREFPPKLIDIIHETVNYKNIEQLTFGQLLANFWRNCSMRYGSFFTAQATQHDFVKEWSETLVEMDISDEDRLQAALDEILNDIRFLSRAPKPLEVIEAYYIRNSDIPTPAQAYRDAVGNGSTELHPIVALTARQIGSYKLRNSAQDKTMADFEKLYRGNVIEYARGKLILTETHTPLIQHDDAKADTHEVSELISHFLNKQS